MEVPNRTDELFDLLANGDRAAAMLACYRTNGGDLDSAWQQIQRLSLDLGEPETALPRSAAADQDIKDLRTYLAPGFWERRKDQVQASLFAMGLFVFSGYLMWLHLPGLVVDLRSYFWEESDAVIVAVQTYSESRLAQTRRMSTDYMDYLFRYEVEGREYVQGQYRVPYYELFGESPFRIGDRVTISYNPAKPGQSLHKRAVYKRSIRFLFALAFLPFAILGVWYTWARERALQRLGRIDEQWR